jgi:anti-anti-sigma regulatory factor
MSFSIVSSRPGIFRVAIDGELEGATVALLRSELAGILGKGPEEVILGLSRPTMLGGAGWGLLQSFLDVLHSRGGRVVLELGPDGVVAVRDLPHLMRLLGSLPDPS